MRWSVVAVVCIVMLSGCGSILDGGGPSSPTPETPGDDTATPTATDSPIGNISSSAPDRPLDAAEAGLPVEPRGTPVDHLDLFVRSMEAHDQAVRSVRVADGSTVHYRFRRGDDVGGQLEDVAVTFAILVGGYDWDVDRLEGTIVDGGNTPIATFAIDADVAADAYHGEVTQREYFEHVQDSIVLLEDDEGTATSTPNPSRDSSGGSTPTAGPAPTPTPTESTPGSGTATPTSTPQQTPDPGPTATPTPEPTATPAGTETPTPEPTPTETPTPTQTATTTPTPTPTSTPTPSPTPTPTQTSTPTPTPTPTETVSSDQTDTQTTTTTTTTTPTEGPGGDGGNGTAAADRQESAAMAAPPGYAYFRQASAWSLLFLVPIGTLALLRERYGDGEN